MSTLALMMLLAGPPAAPSPAGQDAADDGAPVQTFERLPGFSSIVLSHVGRALGLELLPAANGFALEPGVFVTIGLEKMQVGDRDIATLTDGRIADTVAADECARLCPASIFDAFQAQWLALAIEATQRVVQIPDNVVVAAHGRLPVSTLLATSYAVATSRPLRPPAFALVLSSPGRGLRGQPFHLLPPRGLRLDQGAAALALRIAFGREQLEITAEDPRFNRRLRVRDTAALKAVLRDVKKRYPGKQAIVLVPDETVAVADLVQMMVAVRADFPRIVLSAGQDLVLR